MRRKPWTLAIGSALTGTTVEIFHIRAGPWLNLLGPLAFYLLGVRLVGRTAAFIALAIYLFFTMGDSRLGWAYATYSPWLYSNNFVAGIFFTTVLALAVVSNRPTLPRSAGVGVLMGLTFLAHTGPALILVMMTCAVFVRQWRMLLTTGTVAFIVASPFLYSIGVQYRFDVANTTPLAFTWEVIPTISALPQFLKDNALLVGLAAFGAAITTSRLLLVWLGAAAALWLYALSSVGPVIPAFHFWKWSTAAMSMLAGVTLKWLCSTIPQQAWAAARQPTSLPSGRTNLLAITLTVVAVAWQWPTYVNRADFLIEPSRTHHDVAAVKFLRDATRPDDVLLGNDFAVRAIIGIAGRKTVAPGQSIANPYVPFSPRVQARNSMMAAIQEGNVRNFNELAREHDVAAVVSIGASECAAAFRMLPPLARFGDICISSTRGNAH